MKKAYYYDIVLRIKVMAESRDEADFLTDYDARNAKEMFGGWDGAIAVRAKRVVVPARSLETGGA